MTRSLRSRARALARRAHAGPAWINTASISPLANPTSSAGLLIPGSSCFRLVAILRDRNFRSLLPVSISSACSSFTWLIGWRMAVWAALLLRRADQSHPGHCSRHRLSGRLAHPSQANHSPVIPAFASAATVADRAPGFCWLRQPLVLPPARLQTMYGLYGVSRVHECLSWLPMPRSYPR